MNNFPQTTLVYVSLLILTIATAVFTFINDDYISDQYAASLYLTQNTIQQPLPYSINYKPQTLDTIQRQKEFWQTQQLQLEPQFSSQQQKHQLTIIKKQISDMEQKLERLRLFITKLKAKKIIVPSDVSTAIAKADVIIKNIKETEDFDLAIEQIQNFQDIVQTLQQNMQDLQTALQLPTELKQAATQVKQLKSAFTRVAKGAPNIPQINQTLDQIKECVAKIDTAKTETEQLMTQANYFKAADKLHGDIFENMADCWQNIQIVEWLKNAKGFAFKAASEIKKRDVLIKKLSQKQDVSQAVADLENLKLIFNEVKQLINSGSFNVDDLKLKFEKFWDEIEKIDKAIAYNPYFQVTPHDETISAPIFTVPESFKIFTQPTTPKSFPTPY